MLVERNNPRKVNGRKRRRNGRNYSTIIPVSYTHLDVYKRQATLIASVIEDLGVGLKVQLPYKSDEIKDFPRNG